MPNDVKVFDGATWQSIVGPEGPQGIQGEPGPNEISRDPGQCLTIGNDGLIYYATDYRILAPSAGLSDNTIIPGCNGEQIYVKAYPLVFGKQENPDSGGYVEVTGFFSIGNTQTSAFGGGNALTLYGSPATLNLGQGQTGAPKLRVQTGVVASETIFYINGTSVLTLDPRSMALDGTLAIRDQRNAANNRAATITISADGDLVVETVADNGTRQTALSLDRTGNIITTGGSIGTFPAGTATAVTAAEDFVVGTKGMMAYGVVNIDGATAVLNVSNAAGQINLQSKTAATGVVTCSYRFQTQTTGVFRIRDMLVGADRVSWAADGTMTHPGNTAFQGTANTFRQASINSEALGPMNIVAVPGALTLDATHAGKALMLSGDAAAITLPASLAIGTVVELIHTAPTYSPSIVAGAGASLAFNVRNTYYTGASVQFSGRLTSVRALKTNATQWLLFGSLANPTV